MPLTDYLQEVLAQRITITPYDYLSKLPLFLTNEYEFYQAKLHEIDCVLLKLNVERIIPEKIQKHIMKIREYGDHKPVLIFDNLRLSQRKKLVKARIPFIVPHYQIYLPFICLDFNESKVLEVPKMKHFSAMTQQLFLYLMNLNISEVQTKLVAQNLNMAYATANRCIRQFVEEGLIIQTGVATRKSYHSIEKKELWDKGKSFLVSPISRMFVLKALPNNLKTNLSGESALSKLTMINGSDISVYAISKKNFEDIDKSLIINEEDLDDEMYYKLEVWKYDPSIFAKNGIVDPFSLYAIYSESNDERIEIEIEELIEEVLCED